MIDEFGRVNNKAQAIKELDKLRLAFLFNDIKKNPDKYPNDRMEWVNWLNSNSGSNVLDL